MTGIAIGSIQVDGFLKWNDTEKISVRLRVTREKPCCFWTPDGLLDWFSVELGPFTFHLYNTCSHCFLLDSQILSLMVCAGGVSEDVLRVGQV